MKPSRQLHRVVSQLIFSTDPLLDPLAYILLSSQRRSVVDAATMVLCSGTVPFTDSNTIRSLCPWDGKGGASFNISWFLSSALAGGFHGCRRDCGIHLSKDTSSSMETVTIQDTVFPCLCYIQWCCRWRPTPLCTSTKECDPTRNRFCLNMLTCCQEEEFVVKEYAADCFSQSWLLVLVPSVSWHMLIIWEMRYHSMPNLQTGAADK